MRAGVLHERAAVSAADDPLLSTPRIMRPTLLAALLLVAALAASPAVAQWSLHSPPGYYPGDRDGWRQLGWGNDGRFRYSFYGRPGYWTAGCFGCGTWRIDNTYSGYQECGVCSTWLDGRGCTQVPSGACSASGVPSWCLPCQYWTSSAGCINADGCTQSGASTGVSTSGGGTVFYSSNNGGGVATSSGNGAAWVGNGAASASSGGGGGTGAWAGPGGASAWPGK